MDRIALILVGIVEHFPVVERIMVAIFRAYMMRRHKVDVKKFIDAGQVEGEAEDLQKILGGRL